MKLTTLILFVLITLYSCNKESDDVPGYQPGRLVEVSHEASGLGLVYHKFEYSGEDVTDLYYYSSPKIFISKYHFNENQLKNIYYSFENTNKEYFYSDSIVFYYSDNLVIETNYGEGENHKEFNVLKNGKIISSSWTIGVSEKFLDFYYEWSGDNLIRIEKQWWFGVPLTANITEYAFEYSDIENPFYFNNIPSLMKEFNNPYNNFDELTDLIPKCSKNFPSKLTITAEGAIWEVPTIIGNYSFECKIFPNANKPYEVKTTDVTYWERQVDYFLTYEKL